MSPAIFSVYILIGMLFILCFYYKLQRIARFAKKKLMEKCLNGHKCNGENAVRDIWSIPGPIVLPFLGTKWIFFWHYKMSKIHQVYEDFYMKYGPIALEVTAGGIPIVHLYERQDIEKVLRYASKYPFRPPTEIVALYRESRPDRYASGGITNEQGEKWHFLRSKLTPLITSPRVLQCILPTLNEICDDFVDLLRFKRNKNYIVHNFQDLANLMGFEAVCALMLGRRMGFLSPDPPKEVQILAAAVKQLFVTKRDSNYGFGIWKFLPTKTYRNYAKSEETIYRIISNIVDTAIAEEELIFNSTDIRGVFVSILQDSELDIREKKSAIIDFISAGIETLANTLTFILSYITKSDEHLTKIREEFQDCSRTIEKIHITKAYYTKACLQEAFRISPTAFCLARILEEDMNLSGYDLKAGTVILCQTMIACNDPKNFSDAKAYIPKRWLQTFNEGQSRSEDIGATALVVPFGVGKRTCPGKRFVEMELILLIAKLIKEFDMSFCKEMETEFEFLLVPKVPFNIRLKDR